MSDARVLAGKEAKKDGHIYEHKVCKWLSESLNGNFVVDGKPKTKQDIINLTTNESYSLKSVSKNHTQCHLTSSKIWCEYFNIEGRLKNWFFSFFGIPGIDVSDGKNRHHRLTKSDIDDNLNQLAIGWFNDNKLKVFDVIVKCGMNNTPVDNLIWYNKTTDEINMYPIKTLEDMIYNGEWVMNETTLHFITDNNKKMFHLQMKGSGKKYTSGYHGLMFHIYKCF